jgi:hypothetical protein
VKGFVRLARVGTRILLFVVYVWVAAVHHAAGVRRRKALRRHARL